jgi:hypothetical protein
MRLAVCAALAAVTVGGGAIAHADTRSEQAAAEILHQRLKNEAPEQAKLLDLIHGKDIVVVAGSMDHVEQVLDAARIKYTLIQPQDVAQYQLRSNMIVMVNCPGVMPDEGVRRIEKFVRAGGLLYTTDWALKTLVEKAFPGTVAATGGITEAEVTPVAIDKQADNIMSRVLLVKGHHPEWYLEGGSFPIKVLDKQRVEVLAHSDEMGKKYGAQPVVLHFKWEDGEVIHVVSHFYRQLATRGPAVAASETVNQYEGLTAQQREEFRKSQGSGAKSGDVESSYAFQRMTTNIVTQKQQRNQELDKLYDRTVTKPSVMAASPSAPATAPPVATVNPGSSMKVLGRAGKKVHVRDDAGNEGWMDEAQTTARH